MAKATITRLYCVQQATGTDQAVIEAIAGLPAMIVPAEFGASGALEVIQALPAVVAAVDSARADPDDLYVTTSTEGTIDNAIWPGDGNTVDMQAGQSVAPQIALDFSDSLNVSLWDEDTSGDDLLGSSTILESEQGQGEIAKLASSVVEQSYYYIFYRVD